MLSFTAAGLMLSESVRFAELYLDCKDWGLVKEISKREKSLQSRTKSRDVRITTEIISRLSQLSEDQLFLLVEGDLEEQRLLLWFAICLDYQFIQDFAIEVLHDRFLVMQRSITEQDYNAFFLHKLDSHPELDKITESTRVKLRTQTFRMMREAGLINKENFIIRVIPSARMARVLKEQSALASQIYPVFLTDFEVQ